MRLSAQRLRRFNGHPRTPGNHQAGPRRICNCFCVMAFSGTLGGWMRP